jgi:hypothetical protein
MKVPLYALFVAALACAPVRAEENSKSVKASELRRLFADHELGDGVHYAYQFRADGTFSGTEMAKEVSGKWRVSSREVCWTWIRPPGAEECYTVRRKGSEVSLLRNGMEEWYGTLKSIRPGKP